MYEGVQDGEEAAVMARTAKMMEMIIVIFKYEGMIIIHWKSIKNDIDSLEFRLYFQLFLFYLVGQALCLYLLRRAPVFIR